MSFERLIHTIKGEKRKLALSLVGGLSLVAVSSVAMMEGSQGYIESKTKSPSGIDMIKFKNPSTLEMNDWIRRGLFTAGLFGAAAGMAVAFVGISEIPGDMKKYY